MSWFTDEEKKRIKELHPDATIIDEPDRFGVSFTKDDGTLHEQGMVPSNYDEETRKNFRDYVVQCCA